MRVFFTGILLLSFVSNAFSQMFRPQEPFAHTFSIVARDAETGEMAVGVQSHWFSVGSLVSWAEAGVGAIATQSFVNKSFGPRGLALLREGKSAQETLDLLISQDEGEAFRQVAIVDAKGNVAAHTGSSCVAEAGMRQGDGYSVQANMMLTDAVWDAMAVAFEASKGLPLAERIVQTMVAAQDAGGDIRGKQSAALIVVSGDKSIPEWEDPMIELRVDDNPAPIQELSRLLKVFRAYEHMGKGDLALETGDMKEALAQYDAAMKMFPENLEMQYWTAITLVSSGETAKALPMLNKVFQKDENWKELTRRLPAAGLLEVDEDTMKKILEQGN